MIKKETNIVGSALILCSALVLSACGTTNYVAPVNGATAKLLFKTEALQGYHYTLSMYDNAVACTQPKTIVAGQGSSGVLTTAVKTGALVSTSFSGGSTNGRICQMVVSFRPVVGRVYEIWGTLDERGCSSIVYDITDPNKPQIESTLLKRKLVNQVCEPLSAATRITPVVTNSKPTMDDFKDLLPGK